MAGGDRRLYPHALQPLQLGSEQGLIDDPVRLIEPRNWLTRLEVRLVDQRGVGKAHRWPDRRLRQPALRPRQVRIRRSALPEHALISRQEHEAWNVLLARQGQLGLAPRGQVTGIDMQVPPACSRAATAGGGGWRGRGTMPAMGNLTEA